jgi:hypothetical protein
MSSLQQYRNEPSRSVGIETVEAHGTPGHLGGGPTFHGGLPVGPRGVDFAETSFGELATWLASDEMHHGDRNAGHADRHPGRLPVPLGWATPLASRWGTRPWVWP